VSDGVSLAGQWGGWMLGVIGIIAALWPKLRKADLDENGQALRAWQDMSTRHEGEIKSCRDECDQLREKYRTLERQFDEERRDRREMEAQLRKQITELTEQLAGVHRQFIQASQSTLAIVPPGKAVR
jgi:predicted  nucleic acid-binding Zn-ribbon protein